MLDAGGGVLFLLCMLDTGFLILGFCAGWRRGTNLTDYLFMSCGVDYSARMEIPEDVVKRLIGLLPLLQLSSFS